MKCEYGCGQNANFKFKNGKICCSKHFASCPAVKKRCLNGIKKSWTKDRKKNTSERTKKQWKETNSLNSNDVVKRRNKSLKKVWSDNERRELNRKKNKKYWNQKEIKEEARIRSKKNFNNPSYIRKLREGLMRFPNKCEIRIFDLLESIFPGEYEYTGDFRFWINSLNPDFVCKEKKKVIEFFGSYWHKEEDCKIRGNVFEEKGYDSLFIWENELINIEQIKNKVIKFHERKKQ